MDVLMTEWVAMICISYTPLLLLDIDTTEVQQFFVGLYLSTHDSSVTSSLPPTM